jgi:hypothetical protein
MIAPGGQRVTKPPRLIDVVAVDPKSGFPEEDLPYLLPGQSQDDTPATWERRAMGDLRRKWKVSRPIAKRIVKQGLAERDWSRIPPAG